MLQQATQNSFFIAFKGDAIGTIKDDSNITIDFSKQTITYTKREYAEIILDAATMLYQKKYNKFSKSDVYKLKEEIDDDFEDFYDDLLDQIYNVNDDKTLTDKNYENEVLEWMDYYENTLRFT